jgi:hypothetical protein
MGLTTNGVVVTDAIKYVQSKADHLNAASSGKHYHRISERIL